MRGRVAIIALAALCLASFLVGIATIGVAVKTEAWKERAILRDVEKSLDETTRYLDMGVVLRVIVRDETNGEPLVAGVPPVRVVREHRLGGMVDLWGEHTDGRPSWCGPSASPVVWLCSEAQEPMILHADDAPLWQLVQGSEGSGKTYALAMWCGLRVLEHVGHDREIGITAPVTKRMRHVQNAIRKTWPAHWYRWREVLHQYQFRAGPTVQLVSAHTSRSDEGSPIQGANWVAHGGDELQDHFDKEDDIVMRGRSAPDGRYKRLNTSTAKDSAAWRDFRRVVEGSPVWRFAKMLGTANPLVSPEHWARLRAGGMTQREWDRRVLALDVPPEKQLYYNWRRTNDDGTPANLMPIPIGAVDVTADVLASYGRRIGVLVGHDPGTLQHVSMFLKAYKLTPRDRHHRWFVVDEVTSPESTVRAHVADVLKRLQEHHGCNLTDWKGRPSESSPVALVRIDPHTQTGTEHPGRDLYTVWRQFGLIALAAAYQPGTTKPQTIKKESRFDLMNVLLCDDVGGAERRLLVACNDRGAPAAPRLVSAFESLERNEAGEGEADGKGKGDLSHWPAAVGYAVWQVERPRIENAAPREAQS